jgi:diaminopimelate epimerase
MHGAHNDFAIVDTRLQPVDDPVAFARWVCDRHIGIGADGLLLIAPSPLADVRMRVVNPDGSEAEMCGNGIRCVARYLDERSEGDHRRIETLAGIIETRVVSRGAVYEIRVAMGVPHVLRQDGHDTEERDVVVDAGNPHIVLVRHSLDEVDLVREGERLQSDLRFPNGVNVHVCTIEGAQTLRVRHYERGAGLTMACGTGAVACAAATIALGVVKSPVNVHVPGGTLRIDWDGSGQAFMTGPAAHVFDTTIDPRAAVV